MKLLDRHILKNILIPALMAFGVISFLGVASKVRGYAEGIPSGFLTPFDFLQLILFLTPSLITLLVPIAFFFGILMAFGRMAQQGEITAMQASGISLKRMTLPVIIVGVILSIVSFMMRDVLQPWGIKRAYYVLYTEIPQRATIDHLDAGELHDFDGLRIYFADKNTDTHTLYDFDLIIPEPDGVGITFYHAEEAKLINTNNQYTLTLTNMYSISASNTYFKGEEMSLPFPTPPSISQTNIKRFGSNLKDLLHIDKEIAEQLKSDPQGGYEKELHKVRKELAERISYPFTAIAIALIGAPLGVQARRRGRSSLFSVGFGVMVLYYTLLTVSAPTSSSELYEHLLRAWIPNIVLIFIGIAMLWKVDRV